MAKIIFEPNLSTNTNSPVGSSHWYRTLLNNMSCIGQFMRDNELPEDKRKLWGDQLVEYSMELISNYDKIPYNEKAEQKKELMKLQAEIKLQIETCY